METVAALTALSAAVLNGGAGLLGAWLWWRVDPRPWAVTVLRAGQAAAIALAGVAAVAYASGARPDEGLFWLYALLPVAIAFFAEQFRIMAAQTVLDTRGLDDAHAVGTLPGPEQRSVVLQIVRRELGVLVAAAGTIAFLALRALGETPGL